MDNWYLAWREQSRFGRQSSKGIYQGLSFSRLEIYLLKIFKLKFFFFIFGNLSTSIECRKLSGTTFVLYYLAEWLFHSKTYTTFICKQWDTKLKPIAVSSLMFPRALTVCLFLLPILIGRLRLFLLFRSLTVVITLVLVWRRSNEILPKIMRFNLFQFFQNVQGGCF